jgi:hypothetical protein
MVETITPMKNPFAQLSWSENKMINREATPMVENI